MARNASCDSFFLVPKLYLGTFPVPAKFHFAQQIQLLYRAEGIGNEIASASAFPSATWERGKEAFWPQKNTKGAENRTEKQEAVS